MTRRYSFDAVVDELRCTTNEMLAEHLGVTARSVMRWKAEGLTRRQAENIADKVRSHCYELWPEALDHDFADVSIECAAWDCTVRFIPGGRGGSRRWPPRFCSPGCRTRSKQRRLQGVTEPTEKTCEASDCTHVFTAGRNRRFCTSRCRQREKLRRWRATQRGAEAHRLEARRYRAEVKAMRERRQRTDEPERRVA